MKHPRKLVLRSRHVVDLASDELARIVGGTHLGCAATHNTCQEECDLPSNPLFACFEQPRTTSVVGC